MSFEIERKIIEAGTETKVLDEAKGIVSAIVSVTNIADHGNDIIMPGAYSDTLKARMPKVCWSHDWKTPVGKVLEAEELMPGDPRLPMKLRALNAGALVSVNQFNLKTQRGNEAFADVLFWGDEGEWSIGYNANPPEGKAINNRDTGLRELWKVALFEVSPVLFGMAPHTATLSMKTLTAPQSVPVIGRATKAWIGRRGGREVVVPNDLLDEFRRLKGGS